MPIREPRAARQWYHFDTLAGAQHRPYECAPQKVPDANRFKFTSTSVGCIIERCNRYLARLHAQCIERKLPQRVIGIAPDITDPRIPLDHDAAASDTNNEIRQCGLPMVFVIHCMFLWLEQDYGIDCHERGEAEQCRPFNQLRHCYLPW